MQPHWSQRAIKSRLALRVRGHRASNYRFLAGDRKYSLLSEDILNAEVARAAIWRRRYIAGVYDCENFAEALAAAVVYQCASRKDLKYGPAFGTIWYQGHAVNIALLDNGEPLLIEPQKKWGPFSIKTVKRIVEIRM